MNQAVTNSGQRLPASGWLLIGEVLFDTGGSPRPAWLGCTMQDLWIWRTSYRDTSLLGPAFWAGPLEFVQRCPLSDLQRHAGRIALSGEIATAWSSRKLRADEFLLRREGEAALGLRSYGSTRWLEQLNTPPVEPGTNEAIHFLGRAFNTITRITERWIRVWQPADEAAVRSKIVLDPAWAPQWECPLSSVVSVQKDISWYRNWIRLERGDKSEPAALQLAHPDEVTELLQRLGQRSPGAAAG